MYFNMKKLTLLSVLWGVLVMALVESTSIDAPQDGATNIALSSHKFGPSVTGFTLDVLKNLINSTSDTQTTSENLVLSSSSLYKTMLMLYLGSTGGSQTKIRKALHLEKCGFDVTDEFKKWRSLKLLQVDEGERLYYHKALRMKQSIKSLLEENLVEVDTQDPSSAADDINNWVTEVMGRPETLITEEKVKGQKFLPVSLAYSKLDMRTSFSQLVVNSLSFHASEERNVNVDAIEMVDSQFKYYKSELLKTEIFSIKIGSSQLSLMIFLPEEIQTVSGLINLLTVDSIGGVLSNLTEGKIVIKMPQFKLQKVSNIEKMCELLGMCEMMKPNNQDLGGFTNDPDIYITEFLQKVEFEVHAERRENEPTPSYGGSPFFFVNRPFLYMVYDHSSKMPVLVGTIMNPNQQ